MDFYVLIEMQSAGAALFDLGGGFHEEYTQRRRLSLNAIFKPLMWQVNQSGSMDVELELDMTAFRVGGTLLPGLFDQGGVAGVLGEGDGAAGQDAES